MTHSYTTIRVPSSFPASSRPVYAYPIADMTHRNKDIAYPKVCQAVRDVCKKHGTEKILVHTVNYELTALLDKYLQDNLETEQRILSYSRREDKQPTVDSYLHSEEPAVLLAPSLERGIDLPGNQCSAIIIAKVPYPSLGDKQVSQRLYGTGASGKLWYSCETIRAIVQMTGRGMRSAEDRCESYILDEQFVTNIWRRNRALLPSWWSEAVQIRKDQI